MKFQRMIRAATALCIAALAGCAALDGNRGANTVAGTVANTVAGETQRIAVISAFYGELELLLAQVENPRARVINGKTFTTGTLAGRPVVLFLSGVSMVNAALSAQLALDHFPVSHIVFSGIAGGVNPGLNIGDVAAPAEWANYQKQTFAYGSGDGDWTIRRSETDRFGNFGMMFPQPIRVTRKGGAADATEAKFWFAADAAMLAAARRVAANVQLARCDSAGRCLNRRPQIHIGGRGVSGPTFVNNKSYREWVWQNFRTKDGRGVNALDMESSAVATAAHINAVPFIAFRSISDLAGGGGPHNQIDIFRQLAAANAAKVTLAFLRAFPARGG